MALMTIGQLARRVGVRPSAIRYYETEGVIGLPARSTSDYRLYGAEAITLLRFVLSAKEIGLSLDEIRQLIEGSRATSPCALSRKLIEKRLAQVEDELSRLTSLRCRLERLLRQPSTDGGTGVCPLIEGVGISDQ